MGSKKKSFSSNSSSSNNPKSPRFSSNIDKNSTEYMEKRLKNNSAVKKSRDKTKAKAAEATTRVQRLTQQNEQLRSTVDHMTAELNYLKEMLICQAGTTEYLSPVAGADMEYILQEDSLTDLSRISNVLSEMKRIKEDGPDEHEQPDHNNDYIVSEPVLVPNQISYAIMNDDQSQGSFGYPLDHTSL